MDEENGELNEDAVCRDFRHTGEYGKNHTTKYYNLRAVTAVGYRVNSHLTSKITKAKQWAKLRSAKVKYRFPYFTLDGLSKIQVSLFYFESRYGN